MTPEQLAAVKVGDNVTLRDTKGRVTQTTKTWFMVMWEDCSPEIIRRTSSILTGRLVLDVPPKVANDDGMQTAPRHWQDGE